MLTTLEKFGIIAIAVLGFQFTRWFSSVMYSQFLGPLYLHPKAKLKKLGKWAVVTGGTDGIGLAYVEYLAALGINVVIISRTLEKLQNISKRIEKDYKVETKIIEADFTNPDVYQEIEKQLYGYEIGILVNNVGLSYPHPDYFLDLPNKEKIYSSIINCNIFSVTKMCMLLMPLMVERKRGLVINISSTAAQIPSPLLTVYGATKAFVAKFSSDLSAEYKKHGIIIQCIMPGYVATNMSKIRKPTWMSPAPKTYVKHAMNHVGVVETSTGYYPHSMLVGVVKFIESCSVSSARWIIMRMMETIRMRALKRSVG